MITKEQIERINELFHKSKTESGLSAEEKEEQQKLRRLYIDSVKESLSINLNNVKIMDEEGNKTDLKKKEDKD